MDRIRYARINYDFPSEYLLSLVDRIPREAFVDIAATRSDAFEIAPKEVADRAPYSIWDGRQKQIVSGDLGTYTHCVLTHVPRRPELLYANNIRLPDGRHGRPYIIDNDRAWDWRSDLDLSELRLELEKLPFEYLLRVRLIALWEGDHLGHVHRDCIPSLTHPWMDQGFGLINLNLLDGGSTLNIQIDDQIIETNDPCFTFDESLYHGTTRASGKRVQINVIGKFDSERLNALIDGGSSL